MTDEAERYTPGRRRRTAPDAMREWLHDPNLPRPLMDRVLDRRQDRLDAEVDAAAAKAAPTGKERTAAALRAHFGRHTAPDTTDDAA